MDWPPHPSEIQVFTELGTSGENMGSVTDLDSKCRFWLDVELCYTLVFVRGYFESVSADTLKADLSLRVDSRHEPSGMTGDISSALLTSPLDMLPFTLKDVGIGGDPIGMIIEKADIPIFTLYKGDILVLEWTNPDDQRWGVQVGLWDSSARR